MVNKIKAGDVFTSNHCGDFEVLNYKNHMEVTIRFIFTGYTKVVWAGDIRSGNVKDPYNPSIYGIGYIGEGDFKSSFKGKPIKEYDLWRAMLNRCYNIKNKRYLRYGGRGITVAKEWYNFQVFAKWCNEQPHFGEKGFDLDKDLMNPEAKMYHPSNCSFIPQKVNKLLITCNTTRGDYPVGVCYHQNKYLTQAQSGSGKNVHLGYHNTPEEAFQVYKTYKESLIKEVALEEYTKGNINSQVYTTLLNWEILPYPE